MSFDFLARRSVLSRNGMVAASQTLAAQVGVQMLLAGGNAADAAVSVAATLNVTEPTSTGLGGDCFALYYDAKTRSVTALNGSGRSPAALTIDLIKRDQLASSSHRISNPFHAHNITVPGACAGWFDLLERHGTLPMRVLLTPAIRIAEEGFPVAPVTANTWKLRAEQQLYHAIGGRELTKDGRAPRAGEIFRNPGLARTFRTISEGGKDSFYKGAVAEGIVRAVKASGGIMTMDDLAAHESTWDEPISSTYRDLRIWECPPNGQGLAVLIALNVLERFELRGMDPLGTERLHLLIEAMRIAFADTRWFVSDPRFSKTPLNELLSKEYAAKRSALINPRKATLDTKQGSPIASSDTVYFCIVDGLGNACSFINSNYMGFGTGIVPEGWGFSLQNRGNNFSLDPTHPNALEPRKRPYNTIIPGMITLASDGSLYSPFGVMGGFMQPQGHVQVIVGMIDDGLDPQAALNRPRFCIESGAPSGNVSMEEGIDFGTLAGLSRMGHAILPVVGFARSAFGRGQIIRRDPSGVLWAGSDPRADGQAIGI